MGQGPNHKSRKFQGTYAVGPTLGGRRDTMTPLLDALAPSAPALFGDLTIVETNPGAAGVTDVDPDVGFSAAEILTSEKGSRT